MIPGKEAGKRPLWAVYGHYMGLNFGVFWRIGRDMGRDFWSGGGRGGERDRFE